MITIADLIEFENEHAGLDFKLTQYRKNAHEDLLKDLLAMANAHISGDRCIIIGMKPTADDRGIVGITDPLIEEATYQQLVLANIEPELHIKYFPFKHQDKTLAVLQILEPSQQPYILKKAFGKFNQGLVFIRKGSTQMPANRTDLERMYKQRRNNYSFSDKIAITPRIISPAGNKLSHTALNLPPSLQKAMLAGDFNGLLQQVEHIEKAYMCWNRMDAIEIAQENQDAYFLWEEDASKINFTLSNSGEKFLEEVTVQIRFAKAEGLMVKAEETIKPNRFTFTEISETTKIPTMTRMDSADEIIFNRNLGDLKHGLSKTIFDPDLRVFINYEYGSKKLTGTCLLFAKNLPNAFTLNFEMEIEE